jgi:SWI/SNF-related matrix-associated actin-dependent regulator 1 of chromatin subfamily A
MHVTVHGSLFMIQLTNQQRFVADAQYLRSLGMRFHGIKCKGRCAACEQDAPRKRWWTEHATLARMAATSWDEAAGAAFARLEGQVRDSAATDADVDTPCPEGLSYRGYQKAAILFARGRRGVLIGDEMGVGKTIEALGIANDDRSFERVLVICPLGLRANWAHEANRWLVRCQGPNAIRPVVAQSSDDVPGPDEPCVLVANVERMLSHRLGTGEVRARGKRLLAALLAQRWDVLIVDEVHRLRTQHSESTFCVFGSPDKDLVKGHPMPARPGLVSRARRVVLLTGTPIPNRTRDIWQAVHALVPEEFPNHWSFLHRYCGARRVTYPVRGGHGETRESWTFDGCTNSADLYLRLRASCMIRRLKGDVLSELPAKTREIIVLPSDDIKAVVDRERDAWRQLGLIRSEGTAIDYEQALDRLHGAPCGVGPAAEIAEARQDLGLAKVPYLVQHLESMRDQGIAKIVVFGHHHVVLEELHDRYPESVLLYGPSSEREREDALHAFTCTKVPVFIGSIQAAGIGLNLQVASHVLFVEASWNHSDLVQAEDRVHRLGQREPVLVQHFVFDGTIEGDILRRAIEKQADADKVLDAKAPGAPERQG